MLTHLIPLSQFVDNIDEIVLQKNSYAGDWRISQLKAIKSYTAFLLEPLTLSMFVPVSDSGEILEEPESLKLFLNEKLIWFGEMKGRVEDLTHLNLPLTAQAIKHILG